MSWITENKGWLVACCVSAVAGALLVLWLKGSKPKTILPNPVIDTPAPAQPTFVHDTLYRLGGSIGKVSVAESTTAPPETVYREPSPCKPFSLRLTSKPTSLSSVLDSVVLLYYYPSGIHNFEYYNHPATQNTEQSRYPNPAAGFLVGVEGHYKTLYSKIRSNAYLGLRYKSLILQGGYTVESNSHPSWFLGVRKEWRIF